MWDRLGWDAVGREMVNLKTRWLLMGLVGLAGAVVMSWAYSPVEDARVLVR